MGKKPRLASRAKILIESKEELLRHMKADFDFCVENGWNKESFGHTLDRVGLDGALEQILADDRQCLELRGVTCPMNFVKAKLAIEEIEEGRSIKFFLDEREPLVNVTRSLKNEGHRVLHVMPEETYFRVLVEKSSSNACQAVC